MVLVFSTLVAIGSFRLGDGLGRHTIRTQFYCGPRRALSGGFYALAEDMGRRDYATAAKKIELLTARWDEVLFFDEKEGFKERGYPTLVEELQK